MLIEPEPIIVGPLTALGMATAKGTETVDSHHYVLGGNPSRKVANCLPAELYHHGTIVNQDVDSGHLAVAFDEINFRTTKMHQTLRDGTPQSTGAVVPPATVRRLTPTECERLQGFPDGWTAERIDETKGLIPQADSHRYKQMGNAVAVPVVEWIVNRIVE